MLLAFAALAAAAVVLVTPAVASAPAQTAGSTYYVDCRHGRDAATGRSPATAWRTIRRVNKTTFMPGDTILLRRGTQCSGMLAPRGSGTAASPIRVDAFGAGPLPRILAGSAPAAIRLFDQQGWEIADVQTVGGDPRGIFVGADHGTWSHFRISNVLVESVGGTASAKGSGLVDIEPDYGTTGHFTDVVVDGVTAFGTKQWMGIHISCVGADEPPATTDSVAIRNSTVHDVGGDGITIFSCNGATIENDVAHDTGLIQTDSLGTPNGIWTWACANCVVQGNEGYNTDSPADDGGVYDIDFHSSNTTVQYNYAHDAHAYCVAVFGAENQATTNSIVRYNVCANDAREASIANQGDVCVSSWDGGWLDGVQIYNNTFYWNPAVNTALLKNDATFAGSGKDLFENNLVYSTVPSLVDTVPGLTLDHNLYWSTAGSASWTYAGHTYTTFSSYRTASSQDAAGMYANPLVASPSYHSTGRPTSQFRLQAGSPAVDAGAALGSMGTHDFFGDPIPDGPAYDIGADER